ncbi:MAG: hypothetical protein ACOH1X_10355 [Kaistella sp.]
MASAQDQYTKEMYKKFGYHATWLPGVNLQLGDIGTMDNGVFTRNGNIKKQGISFEIREDKTRTTLEYYSQGGVSVSQKLSGKAAPPGSVFGDIDAGIIVEFLKDKAVLFKANNTSSPSIEDAIALGKEVLKRYEAGEWNKNYVIITEILEAETLTVLISNQANTKVELKAQANIKASHFDIADAAFKFGTEIKGGLETHIIAQEGATPLFKMMGIKKGILRPTVFEAMATFPVYPENFEPAENIGKEVSGFDFIEDEEKAE